MADEAAARVKLSAVIACYKDAEAIPIMHRRLSDVFSSLAVDYEIIFVNDGSQDDTDSVLKELAAKDSHVLAIEHSRNFGSQSAFVSGMQLATGDAVILLDGDLQDPCGLRTWVGFRQIGVDYVRPVRAFGRSTHSWLKNIWWAKKAIVSFSYLPLELLGYAGATMTVLSLLAVIYQFIDCLRRPQLPHGISTIIVLILFCPSRRIRERIPAT